MEQRGFQGNLKCFKNCSTLSQLVKVQAGKTCSSLKEFLGFALVFATKSGPTTGLELEDTQHQKMFC